MTYSPCQFGQLLIAIAREEDDGIALEAGVRFPHLSQVVRRCAWRVRDAVDIREVLIACTECVEGHVEQGRMGDDEKPLVTKERFDWLDQLRVHLFEVRRQLTM